MQAKTDSLPTVAPSPIETVKTQVAISQPIPLTEHEVLMTAAGIAPSDFKYVEFIVQKESSWNPNATEPKYGAHGLPQALPYSKTGCEWVDAVCQLKWANTYAQTCTSWRRYCGWQGAYNFWVANHHW